MIRSLTSKTLAVGVAGAIAVATVALQVEPAHAASAYGCNWPRVCFYKTAADWNNRRPTATFQDPGYWQNLGSRSYGAAVVYNSRNDDGALVHYTNGTTYCVWPNEVAWVSNLGTANMVWISDDIGCSGS